MASTIDEGFEELRSNLEITDLQEETVSTRQKNVRKALEDDFTILDSFLTGSYRRSTMIAPLKEADVDIFIVLDPKYCEADGQSALLDSVKKALRKTYTKTPDISPDGHAVTVTFTDFKVDVVPGFYRKGGGYLIPDAQLGRWLATDPKKHVEIWTAANKAHKGDLVPLIKMLKGWNKSRGLLRSFHLETLTLTILDNVRIASFPSGVRYVFDKARDKIDKELPDPAGYNDDVAAHVNTQEAIDKIVKRLNWAYETALEAERLADKNRIEAAFGKWSSIFKDYFPSYG
jgi:Second Messenger Oligonucleotide or Dinucleotide Synthetase domain